MSDFTQALRDLATFIDEHDDLLGWQYFDKKATLLQNGADLGIHLSSVELAEQKRFIRKLTRAIGGQFSKSAETTSFYLRQPLFLGFWDLTIYADRDAVCERKLVRTDDVEVPAKPAVEAHVEQVPVYEWECKSIFDPALDLVVSE